MTLSAIDPAAAVLTPADIAGSHAPNDPTVTALIAAVTAELDAPYGWLGRSIGRQTLRLTLPAFGCEPIWLSCGPVLAVGSVKYLDASGVEQTLDPADYRLAGNWLVPSHGKAWPSAAYDQPDAVRITYTAGYDDVPVAIKRALILLVQNLKKVQDDALGGVVLFRDVEGVGQRRYESSKIVGEYVSRAARQLLSGYRLYR